MLIGRDDILDDIRTRDPESSPVVDLRGGLGTGKTTILRHVRGQREIPAPSALYADLEFFDPGHPGQTGARASVGAVQANFSKVASLLEHLARQVCPPEVVRALEQAVLTARNDEVVAGRLIDWQELERPFSPADLVEAWRRAARSVLAEFLRLWEQFLDQPQQRGRSFLLLLDNVDRLADQEMGIWLRDLVRPYQNADQHAREHDMLGRTVVVLTRAAGSEPLFPANDRTRSWSVSDFTEDEVEDYLNELRGAPVDRKISRLIYGVSGGHPATLRLVQELLWGSSLVVGNPPLELLFGLPAEQEEKVAALVERLLERHDGPEFMRALEAVAVARWFDAKVLTVVLAADADRSPSLQDRLSIRDLLDRLRELPFVEQAEEKGTWRIHEYVRSSLLARMAISDPDRLQNLHMSLANHYEARLTTRGKTEGGELLTYDAWHFLELPIKQVVRREWLHHMAQLTDDSARRKALLEASRLFLDTWWWWSNYVHFDFSDRLVSDLGEVVRSLDAVIVDTEAGVDPGVPTVGWPQLKALHEAFVDVLEHYPLRSQKWPDADWQRVRGAALTIERVCGLSQLPPRATIRQKHVSALLHTLLAHTWRYQDSMRPDADDMYARAERLFVSTKEAWNVAWVAYEVAELHWTRLQRADAQFEPEKQAELYDRAPVELAAGRSGAEELETAMQGWRTEIGKRWQQAADLVQPRSSSVDTQGSPRDTRAQESELDAEDAEAESLDHELIANLHRLRGDVLWGEGRSEQAARCYGRAVLHAYLFHLVGNPPDEYTQQFYVDVLVRAINPLVQLWRSQQEDLAVMCSQVMWREARRARRWDPPLTEPVVRERLAEAVHAGQGVLLARTLFPRGPQLEELDKEDSPFTREYQEFRKQLDGNEFKDLHEPV